MVGAGLTFQDTYGMCIIVQHRTRHDMIVIT